MFYSDTLLQKTGPLARVWLAANLERKLTKQNVLQSNIDNNVRDIIGTGQAPLALRLSGQLLLGVVRIYNRKAKYLVDDCSEALGKLKLAFRPGNVDLPANQLLAANPNALTLPDTITEQDLFAQFADPADLLGDVAGFGGNFLDMEASQLLPETQITPSARRDKPMAGLEEEDLFGFDNELSIELGRRAVTPLADAPSMLQDDLFDFGDTTINQEGAAQLDVPMLDADDTVIPMDDAARLASPAQAGAPEQDTSYNNNIVDETDEVEVQAAQRVKRRKVLRQDVETELRNSQIKQQQQDRSAVTRAPTFLPQDPFLLQLIEAQRSGVFVSSILGEGQMLGMAPELRGVLSIEIIRKAGEKKRKRDSGIADMESESDKVASPRLDIPLDDSYINIDAQDQFVVDETLDHGTMQIMDENEVNRIAGQDLDESIMAGQPFDVTEAPLLHPSQSGPVSVGTKTAVAALRHHFAPDHKGAEPPTSPQRTRTDAKFTDLCPTATTDRAEATKMFFELLVLGTKDAVKIEQVKDHGLHGTIKVRGKRGLWGQWAEMGARSQQQVLG